MFVYIVWSVGVAVTAAAALRMTRLGLAGFLPTVRAYLAACSVYWVVSMIMRAIGWREYLAIYSIGQPLILLAKCAAVSGIFWAVATNYPKFQVAGNIFFNVLAAGGIGAAFLVALATPPVHADQAITLIWHAVALTQRYTGVALFVILAGALVLIPKSQYIPIPQFAMRAARIMCADALLSVLAAWIQHSTAYTHPQIQALVGASHCIAIGGSWMFLRAYQESPAPQMDPAHAEALETLERRLAAERHCAEIARQNARARFQESE